MARRTGIQTYQHNGSLREANTSSDFAGTVAKGRWTDAKKTSSLYPLVMMFVGKLFCENPAFSAVLCRGLDFPWAMSPNTTGCGQTGNQESRPLKRTLQLNSEFPARRCFTNYYETIFVVCSGCFLTSISERSRCPHAFSLQRKDDRS
jgi:hypothetical protein